MEDLAVRRRIGVLHCMGRRPRLTRA